MSSSRRKVVLASRNPDKVAELRGLFTDTPFEVLSATDFPGLPEVVEDGTTIEGNATRKALLTAAWTGEIAVADDTSLQVRTLNGLPDIFAARFSGAGATYESNVSLLLDLMAQVPDGSRQARFATACVWIDPGPGEVQGPVGGPADLRWLHNPWARAVQVKDARSEPEYWKGLVDHDQVWENYRTSLLADLVSWGHDRGRLRGIAEGLVASRRDGSSGSVVIPDPRIWSTRSPAENQTPRPRIAPVALAPEAPGRGRNEELFLQLTAKGRLVGTIARQPIGTMGFGYDPVFLPEGDQRTLAELEVDEKNAISHRGRALRRLLAGVRQAYELG